VRFRTADVALNTWFEATQYVYMTFSNASFPYLFVGASTDNGTVRLDLMDVEPVSAPGTLAASVTSQSSAYTVATRDIGGVIQWNSGSGGTITVPPDTDIDAPVGAIIGFLQLAAGTLSIAAGSGVTLLSPPNRTDTRSLSGRYARAAIVKVAGNTWSLDGSLSP
jgi:hypothetical protein